ncbi:MAG: lasso peptide biosynthesis B2 protein [Byssovorax sp.]
MAQIPPRARLGARALSIRLRLGRMLARRPLPEVLGALDPRPPARPVPLDTALVALGDAQRVITGLGRIPDTCLYRSLARYAILRHAGHPARFVMGLRPSEPEIVGHAWVELDGRPVGEPPSPGIVVTFSYPDRDPPGSQA